LARFLVLDWDHQQLHLISAAVTRGKVNFQKVSLSQEEHHPTVANSEALGRRLKEILKANGIAPAPVLACVGRDRVILKEIRYPQVPPAEEAAIVRFQAAKELTDPAEEVVIDYTPTGETGPNGERRAMGLVVRREVLAAYNGLCRTAGLKLEALTPRPFGIAACLKRLAGSATPAPDPADAVVAVLTVSGRWAEFAVVRGDALLFARSLTVGPMLADQVRRNLALYAGQPHIQPARDAVRALYVASDGEHALLRERLQDTFGIPVHPLDPFAGAENLHIPGDNRSGFTGAAGLLYAWADKQKEPINFAHPKQPAPPRNPNKLRLAVAAGLLLAAVVGVGVLGARELAAKDAELKKLTRQKARLDEQLTRLGEDARHIEALKTWEEGAICWLDELYDLTAYFPFSTKVRLAQFNASPLPRNPKDKDKHVARINLTGVAARDDGGLLNVLADSLHHEKHYRAGSLDLKGTEASGPRQAGQTFTTRVDVEKQTPDLFTVRFTPPAARGFPGGFPGGRGGEDLLGGFDDDLGGFMP
jgi:Tfp pilus assembly PilM family ATPase